MKALMQRLGYEVQNEKLLETALTHPSYGGDHHVEHYQRMEFLGDAVLELVVSQYLFHELPEVDEGKLTRLRAALVREETLYHAAKRLGLGEYIRLSVGEERSGGRNKPSILADVLESVFAAVYLDGGMEPARRVIFSVLSEELEPSRLADRLDSKSRLQEVLQQNSHMPRYDFIKMEGPPHAPTFYYRVSDGENVLGEGSGSSKQQAQQKAALDALNRMGALS